MGFEFLTEQINTARTRAAQMQAQAPSHPVPASLLQETFAELQASLEELRVAEAELRQQNEELAGTQTLLEGERRRYQELFDFAPESYLVTNMQGLIQEGNAAAAALLGVSTRFLKGKPIVNFVSESMRSAFRQQLLGLAGPAAERVRLPLILAPRSGQTVPAEATVTRSLGTPGEQPALLWVVHDLTERTAAEQDRLAFVQEQAARVEAKKLERQIREQSVLLETLLTTAPTGFAMASPEGQLLRVNGALARMLGVDLEDLAGRSVAEVLGASHWQQLQPLFRQAVQGGAGPDTELAYEQQNGAVCHLLVSHYAVQTDDALLGVGMVVSDITQRKADEAALQTAYEREHRIAEVLQRSLLRSVPDEGFEGLSVATFYEAALAEAQIGGDFFDAFTIGSGKVALLVGDVSGKGLAAAASTAEIKYALRAYVREDINPRTTLERLNNFMCDARRQGDWDDNLFAVLSLVVLDPSTGHGSLALAGAEPVLVRRASGEIESMEPLGMLLGIEPNHDYAQAEITLAPGDTLIMVTDGITEARRNRTFLGMDGLVRLLSQAPAQGSAQEVGESVLKGVQSFVAEAGCVGCLSDDACILVARRQAA